MMHPIGRAQPRYAPVHSILSRRGLPMDRGPRHFPRRSSGSHGGDRGSTNLYFPPPSMGSGGLPQPSPFLTQQYCLGGGGGSGPPSPALVPIRKQSLGAGGVVHRVLLNILWPSLDLSGLALYLQRDLFPVLVQPLQLTDGRLYLRMDFAHANDILVVMRRCETFKAQLLESKTASDASLCASSPPPFVISGVTELPIPLPVPPPPSASSRNNNASSGETTTRDIAHATSPPPPEDQQPEPSSPSVVVVSKSPQTGPLQPNSSSSFSSSSPPAPLPPLRPRRESLPIHSSTTTAPSIGADEQEELLLLPAHHRRSSSGHESFSATTTTHPSGDLVPYDGTTVPSIVEMHHRHPPTAVPGSLGYHHDPVLVPGAVTSSSWAGIPTMPWVGRPLLSGYIRHPASPVSSWCEHMSMTGQVLDYRQLVLRFGLTNR